MTEMLDAALEFAQHGWPVFPCVPQNKAPATRHGFKDASKRVDVIHRWWEQWPYAMIGVPTGHITKAFVLDINPPPGMTIFDCISKISDYAGVWILKHTRITTTPAGAHIWFLMPEGIEIRNRGTLLDGAIDCVRGEGGYVIVPPSVRPDGQKYRWSETREIMEPPGRLIDLVRKQ